jgi:hypothetical protein
MERAQYAVADVPPDDKGRRPRIADRRPGRNESVSFYPAKALTAADLPAN